MPEVKRFFDSLPIMSLSICVKYAIATSAFDSGEYFFSASDFSMVNRALIPIIPYLETSLSMAEITVGG